MAEFNITCLRINADSSEVLDKPLKELNLRAEYGINILAIKRRDEMLESVRPDEVLKQGDVIYVQGNQTNTDQFFKLIN
jgi:CPA2 family monovalent cation:H+ antiporter-2